MTSSKDLLRLYRGLLKEGSQLADYNFREYAVRRTKSDFRKKVSEAEKEALYAQGLKDLQVVQRQKVVQSMFLYQQSLLDKLPRSRFI